MMTAEDFKKYARDIFAGQKIKVEDTSHEMLKLKSATKLFLEKKRIHDEAFKALFERFKPIPLQKITRRICGF